MPALKNIIILLLPVLLSLWLLPNSVHAINEPTRCSGTVVDLGFPKKLLSFSELSRPGTCGVKPTKIVLHTTWGQEDAEGLFQYFETKPEGRYASTQFVVGKDGAILQMLETLEGKVEIGWAVASYNDDSISIEIGHNGNYNSKDELPQAQYESVVKLVQALMQTYNIPLGNIEHTTSNTSNAAGSGDIQKSTTGVFGHYQLNPDDRTDPGSGFLADIRADLKAGGAQVSSSTGGSRSATGCWITAVGNPNEDDKPVCKTSSVGPAGPCQEAPTPPDRSLIRQAIIDKWGITLNLTEDQLALAWEEFHEIDCTGFLQDIQGTVVGSWGNEYAQQLNCPGQGGSQVMFSNQWSGEFMKAILTHELTHVWQFCSSRGEQNRILNGSAYQEEGGLTNYSRTGCGFNVTLLNEDHADTIALYLNPEQGELTCGNGAPNPFANGAHPVHRNVAEMGVGEQP